MKKKILGIAVTMGVALLAGCSQNTGDEHENVVKKRNTYVQVLSNCEEKLERKSETKLSSSVSLDNFYLVNDTYRNDYDVTRAFVHFIKLLYENKNFKISDDAVCVDCDYIKNGKTLQDNKMALLGKMDTDKGLVNYELYGTSNTKDHYSSEQYMILEANYDFKENALTDFDIYMYTIENGDINKNSTSVIRYTSGNLYYGINDEVHNEVFYQYANTNYWSKHKDNLVNAEKIGDFSKEYVDTTNTIFGDDYFNSLQ